MCGIVIKMNIIYSVVPIFYMLFSFVYGDKKTELQSPEEELYGVKYAQDCEGILNVFSNNESLNKMQM